MASPCRVPNLGNYFLYLRGPYRKRSVTMDRGVWIVSTVNIGHAIQVVSGEQVPGRGVMHAVSFRSSVVKFLFALSLTLAIGLLGCTPDPERDIHSFQQAGSVHVSVLSIAAWDDYYELLQPKFAIDPTAALGLALPRTSTAQSSVQNVLSGQLLFGLPQSSQTTNQTDTSQSTSGNSQSTNTQNGTTTTNNSNNSSNNNTQNNTTTNTSGPGTLPNMPFSMPSTAGNTPVTGTVRMDPILTYTAAAAVYQEIQLLNNYLIESGLTHDRMAYLVRTQVGVTPYLHNEPFDAYVNLSAFVRCSYPPESDLADKQADSALRISVGRIPEPIVVLPLLVTDDVETGQTTNSVDVARQLAFSLGGIIHNVAAQAELEQLNNTFKSMLGTDYNSLYMVSRGGASNSLQVRLGAAVNPSVDYSMLSQSHNVTFVALVPRAWVRQEGCQAGSYPEIDVDSYAQFRNAKRGNALPGERDSIHAAARKILQEQFPGSYSGDAPADGHIDELLADVNGSRFAEFKNTVMPDSTTLARAASTDLHAATTPGTVFRAWTGLAAIAQTSDYAYSAVQIPYRYRPDVDENQTVVISDNCKDTATATIVGYNDLPPGNFLAELYLPKDRKVTPAPAPVTYLDVAVAATAITQSSTNGPLKLQFPSLQGYSDTVRGKCPTAAKPIDAEPAQFDLPGGSKIVLYEARDNRWVENLAKGNHRRLADGRLPDVVQTCNKKTLNAELLFKLGKHEIEDEDVTRAEEVRYEACDEPLESIPPYFFSNLQISVKPPDASELTLGAPIGSVTTDSQGTGVLRLVITPNNALNSIQVSLAGAIYQSYAFAAASAKFAADPVKPAGDGFSIKLPEDAGPGETISKVTQATVAKKPAAIVLDVKLTGLIAGGIVTVTATGSGKQEGKPSDTVSVSIISGK